ncbi:histone-lysine N-methyltransferase SETMAR [Trichonephila clavipes]|nr:histone-lysine N-methyltransferase SETMAR [Trichonephila clavipes]
MQQSIEQRYAIKFCVRLGKSGASRTAGKAYHKLKFLDGTKCLKKAGRAWRTSPVQVARQHEEPQKTNKVPDLAPADFFLFPKGNSPLKGRHYGTLDDVKRACTHALKDVSVGDFQGAYEAWKRPLQMCVHAQGAYFEDY